MRAEEASHQLGNILERVSDALVALDKDWRYTYVNQRAADLFGRRAEDLIGRHIWTEFPEGVGQPFYAAYQKAMAEQVFIEMENYYAPWDRWFENRIYPSPDGLSIFFHEITARKQADRAARESAELLQQQNHVLEVIARGAPVQESLDLLLRAIETQCAGMLCSILLLDVDGVHMRHGAAPSLPESFIRAVDGQPIGPHAGSCGTAAFRREPVIVEDIATDLLWADYKQLALEHDLRACWSTPIFDADRRVLGTFALYFRNPGRPTERHWQLIDLTTHTAAIAIVKHRESEALRASEERFQIVGRATNDAIWDWDLMADGLWWNDAITTLFKYSPEDVAAGAVWGFRHIHPEDRERVVSGVQELMNRKEQFWSAEYRFRRGDGSYADVFDRAFVIYDSSGKPIRMIGAVADISERKRALEILEQRVVSRTSELQAKNLELEYEIGQRNRVEDLLRRRNEELKAFAYTVSHDLKAPLRGIAGYAQELKRRHSAGLGERALFCLKQITSATHNLDHLIDDLLYYSRLDAETPTLAAVNLSSIVEVILRDRNTVIVEQNTEITINLDVTIVHSWERGLVQVLTNLLDNALKYSRNATPSRIQISSYESGDTFQIVVADNGIGFDMKYHDRIFGLFNRLVRQEEFEGTGAGLAIVKKVMERLGGEITAEAKLGSGAKFIVELPKHQIAGAKA